MFRNDSNLSTFYIQKLFFVKNNVNNFVNNTYTKKRISVNLTYTYLTLI